jgi:hypothetical protein
MVNPSIHLFFRPVLSHQAEQLRTGFFKLTANLVYPLKQRAFHQAIRILLRLPLSYRSPGPRKSG